MELHGPLTRVDKILDHGAKWSKKSDQNVFDRSENVR
jgi:hypothetical protein